MVVEPSFNAVTSPVLLTVATDVLLDVHVAATLSVVSAGSYVSPSCVVCPFLMLCVVPVIVIAFKGLMTVTFVCADKSPHFAVTVAVPFLTAVTVPSFETVATDESLVDHVIVPFASAGTNVAVSLSVAPFTIVVAVLSTVIPVAGTTTFTLGASS